MRNTRSMPYWCTLVGLPTRGITTVLCELRATCGMRLMTVGYICEVYLLFFPAPWIFQYVTLQLDSSHGSETDLTFNV